MITNQQIKLIQSLKLKKYREEHGLFIVEGKKMVEELIASNFEIEAIYHTPLCGIEHLKATQVGKQELERMSHVKTNHDVLALVKITTNHSNINPSSTVIVLDTINDPGNLGTIIRTADWFGINTIYCSENTVDVYNPKVIQASMGSVFRVKVIYSDLKDMLEKNTSKKVYGAVLNGNNLYSEKLDKDAFIVIGSESHGISKELIPFISHPITIPSYGRAESLNAAIATSIICYEFNRGN